MERIKTAIPKEIISKILEKEENRVGNNTTRFYSYIEQQRGTAAISIVAVKDGKKFEGKKKRTKFLKKVVVFVQGEKYCYCKDIIFKQIAGYLAYFNKENELDAFNKGMIINQYEDKYWESGYLNYWRIYNSYRVLNPEYLTTIDKFKYCAWDGNGDLFDYLNSYAEKPELEYISKIVGSKFALSKAFLKKIDSDKNFVKWLIENKDSIDSSVEIPVVLMAYRKNYSISRAVIEYACRKFFIKKKDSCYGYAHYSLLQELYHKSNEEEKCKIRKYIVRNEISPHHYEDYLKALDELGINRKDTKNAFPKNWAYWSSVRFNQAETLRAKKDAKNRRKLLKEFKIVVKKYESLSYKGDLYSVIIADSPATLVKEGSCLHHCVGNGDYAQRVRKEESLILLIRRKSEMNTPFATAEYSIPQKRILQCYGAHDKRPPQDVIDFVDKWAKIAKQKVEAIQRKVA